MDDRTLLAEMGKRIARQRKYLGLTQQELAERSEVSDAMISTAENGMKALRCDNLLKISRALEVSTDYLLTGQTNPVDSDMVTKRLEGLTPEQLRTIEKIIDQCIELCDS